MKKGIFGGSFNPPHICHSLVCLYVLETTDIERIMLVPCYQHPFGKPLAAFESRFEMCRLVAAPFGDRVEVSDIERRRREVSYTVDTVFDLKQSFPADEFSLIIGSDIEEEKENWKDFDRIQNEVEIVTVRRLGHGGKPDKGEFFLPDISSTSIRERIARGEAIDRFVPGAVNAYIEQNHLYRST